ncbi:MAG: glutamate--tRNA ligase [Bacteroidota bacterium]
MGENKVIVRYAPSPTGPQHIGGIRTALYNYLFAKKHRGTFILRIEDTDQTRFVPKSESYIMEALAWLGITPDQGVIQGGPCGPYRQSERKSIYKSYAEELIQKGKAYYAFDTTEALDTMRSRLKAAKVAAPKYNAITRAAMQNSLTLPAEEVTRRLEAAEPYVIRLLVDPKATVKVYDQVRGWVKVQGASLDDKVLLKEDGMPTYHLANIVDDHLMGITHVIRGEEWLPSAPIHALLYEAFGWEPPLFVHLPLILRNQGEGKLSKRVAQESDTPIFPLTWDDPTSGITFQGFRERGYLPEALLNFLALLGWHPSGDQEIFTHDELIEAFSLKGINKSGARFDVEKAQWINQQHLKKMNDGYLATTYLLPSLKAKGLDVSLDKAIEVCHVVKERICFPKDLPEESIYFFQPPPAYPHAVTQPQKAFINACITQFASVHPWNSETIKASSQACTQAAELKSRHTMPLLRKILTGREKGVKLPLMMAVLGQEEVINRLKTSQKSLVTS